MYQNSYSIKYCDQSSIQMLTKSYLGEVNTAITHVL